MSASARDLALRSSYRMFHYEVVHADGREKTYIAQNGGGTLTVEQMADRAVEFNMFPGAKSVKVSEANTIMPAKTIEKNIEMIKKSGLRARPAVTPRPTVGKPVEAPVFDTPPGVPDANPDPALAEPEPQVVKAPVAKK